MKHTVEKRRMTGEDSQRLQELRAHCQRTIGVDFYDASGNLQLSVIKSGRESIVSKVGILVTKLTRHRYRHRIIESIDLLFLTNEGEAIEIHDLLRSDLTARTLEQILGFSSGIYFSAVLNDILVPLVEEQLCFKSSNHVPVGEAYHFSGRDPEKIQYVCRDQTLLKPLKSVTSGDLIKVPDKVSAFELLGALIRVAPDCIAIEAACTAPAAADAAVHQDGDAAAPQGVAFSAFREFAACIRFHSRRQRLDRGSFLRKDPHTTRHTALIPLPWRFRRASGLRLESSSPSFPPRRRPGPGACPQDPQKGFSRSAPQERNQGKKRRQRKKQGPSA